MPERLHCGKETQAVGFFLADVVSWFDWLQ